MPGWDIFVTSLKHPALLCASPISCLPQCFSMCLSYRYTNMYIWQRNLICVMLGEFWVGVVGGNNCLGTVCGTSEHNCLVSYLLCWRRHVSANVGHLQVTKMYNEEKLYTVWSQYRCILWTVNEMSLSVGLYILSWKYLFYVDYKNLMDIYIYIYIYIYTHIKLSNT